MKKRYHLPTQVTWQTEVSAETAQRVQRTILTAVRRAVERAAGPGGEIVIAGPVKPGKTQELFAPQRYQAGRGIYQVPSYDDAGAPVDVKVKPDSQEAAEAPAAPVWSEETIGAHIRATFGEYGPRGQTMFGMQTPGGLVVVTGVAGGRPQLAQFDIHNVRRDTEGHWESTGENLVYPVGRYVFRVTGPSDQGAPQPYVAVVEDSQGERYNDRIWTKHSPGFRMVFDVPEAPRLESGAPCTGCIGGGGGILPGHGILVNYQCHPFWNAGPLSDPFYTGMSEDDLWRLFINLCNARAIKNLDLSEDYIRHELVPRYTGPRGATNTLSDFSRHSIQHFQERLRLLRALMYAYNRLWQAIKRLEDRLNPLIFQSHGTSHSSMAPLGFGASMRANAFWQTPMEPAPQYRELVRELRQQLEEKGADFRTVMAGITRLLEEDPFLTFFVEGLKTEGIVDVPDEKEITSKLADEPNFGEIQHEILKQLDKILASLALARQALCRDPERILDVPMVFEGVLASLEGINEHFDKVAREGIARHHKKESWIDIGLSAIGLVLFVGGLIVSLAGGPAGVVAFMSVSGTVLGGVNALRSMDRAQFTTQLANASVERGHGLVSLEAARDARFWATVDSILVGVDVALSGTDLILKSARPALQLRQAEAATRLSAAAERFDQAVAVGRRLDFETLMERAAPRGQLSLNPDELQALGDVATETNVTGDIAEQLVESTVLPTREYLPLASKLNSNQGIDHVFVRRQVFEKIFGPVADARDASRILARASEDQMRQLGQALSHPKSLDDLVSVETKFNRAAQPVEEILSSARRGVQQNRAWFADPQRGVVQAMRGFSKNPEVQATGRLLEEVIGPGAQFIDRMARIGIRVNPQGGYELTRLTEQIINDAAASKALYRSMQYQRGYLYGLLRAERLGDQAKAARFRSLLQTMNQQIDALDQGVGFAKQAQEASRRAAQALERAEPALNDITVLAAKSQTPGITQALLVATGTAQAHLQAARQHLADAEADYGFAQNNITDAKRNQSLLENRFESEIDDMERVAPGTRAAIRKDVETLQREHPELFKPD